MIGQPGFQVDEEAAANGIGKLLQGLTAGLGTDPFSQTLTQGTGTTPTGNAPAATGHVNPTSEKFAISQEFGGSHPGVDIATPVNTPLLAAIQGRITHAADDDPGGYGQWVEITGNDGTVVRYGHMNNIRVAVGQEVKAGDLIGASGGQPGTPGAGNATGPHLHFEVHVNGQGVDPVGFLAGGWQIAGEGSVPTSTATAAPRSPEAATASGVTRLTSALTGKAPSSDQIETQTTAASSAGPEGIDSFLAATRQHESGGNYTIYNTSGLSDASGAYQYISSTWNNYGGYANAADAPPAIQDQKARADAQALFDRYHDWRLVAIAWYGGPGIADQVARGEDPGSPEGQGPYLSYGDTIVRLMGGQHG